MPRRYHLNMQTESRIDQRFAELTAAAAAVEQTRIRTDYSEYVDAERFHQWAVSAQALIERVCGKESVHAVRFAQKYNGAGRYLQEFTDLRGVFLAAHDDYKGGYLFVLRALVEAELCCDVLDQSDELLRAGYKDAACVVAGVALESAMREMAKARAIPLGKLDAMNSALAKDGAYNLGMQKQITAWADRRNSAAHGKWDAYLPADVRDLIDGVRRFVAERL